MKLRIEVPRNYSAERNYILSTVLGEFLGLDVYISLLDREDILISANSKQFRCIV